MPKHLLHAVLTAIVLVGCASPKPEKRGDYFIACGDKDVYIVDAAASEGDSLAILWHWNIFESYGQIPDEARNWKRRRRLEMDYTEYVKDEDIQLDNGFSTDACIQIRSMDDKPLTIAGITPVITLVDGL